MLAVLRQNIEVVARKVHVSEALFQPQGKFLKVEPSAAVDIEIQEDLFVFQKRDSTSPGFIEGKSAVPSALQMMDLEISCSVEGGVARLN